MREKKISCASRKFLLPVARLSRCLSIYILEEVLDEQADVAGPLAERRYLQNRDRKAVEEILAKAAFSNLLREGTVGGGYDADVDLERPTGTQAHDLALLDGAQELHLRGAGQFANLVQEKGAAVRGLEVTFSGLLGVRERALLVPEQL